MESEDIKRMRRLTELAKKAAELMREKGQEDEALEIIFLSGYALGLSVRENAFEAKVDSR